MFVPHFQIPHSYTCQTSTADKKQKHANQNQKAIDFHNRFVRKTHKKNRGTPNRKQCPFKPSRHLCCKKTPIYRYECRKPQPCHVTYPLNFIERTAFAALPSYKAFLYASITFGTEIALLLCPFNLFQNLCFISV